MKIALAFADKEQKIVCVSTCRYNIKTQECFIEDLTTNAGNFSPFIMDSTIESFQRIEMNRLILLVDLGISCSTWWQYRFLSTIDTFEVEQFKIFKDNGVSYLQHICKNIGKLYQELV